MGYIRKYDSIKGENKPKTIAELQEENLQLQEQITDLQGALCDIYETILGG